MKNTIVTLTGPTCSGKTYLHDALIKDYGFVKLKSCTTRAMREGEVDGVDYDFISMDEAKSRRANDEFIECTLFSLQYYGVTRTELAEKIATGKPIVVVLEPLGLATYEKVAKELGYRLLKVYVESPLDVRIKRLNNRTFKNVFLNTSSDVVSVHITDHTRRLENMLLIESKWPNAHEWDLKVTGEDALSAMFDIKNTLK